MTSFQVKVLQKKFTLLHADFSKIVLKYSNEVHLLRYLTPLVVSNLYFYNIYHTCNIFESIFLYSRMAMQLLISRCQTPFHYLTWVSLLLYSLLSFWENFTRDQLFECRITVSTEWTFSRVLKLSVDQSFSKYLRIGCPNWSFLAMVTDEF